MRRRRHKYNNIIAKLKADADAAALKQSETTAKLRDEVRPYSPITLAAAKTVGGRPYDSMHRITDSFGG